MSQIVIVTSSDISVLRNGMGIVMSYFGNNKWHIVEAKDLRDVGKSEATVVSEFVAYLNLKPIVK
jgi:hypothetical protein